MKKISIAFVLAAALAGCHKKAAPTTPPAGGSDMGSAPAAPMGGSGDMGSGSGGAGSGSAM